MENDRESIVRVANKTSGYSIMLNATFQRKDLSARAKGIYAYMMTLPPDWEIHKAELFTHFTEGRDALNSAFKELETAGYINCERIRGEGGAFETFRYTIFEEPPKAETSLANSGATTNGKPVTGKPFTENPQLPNTETPPNTNNQPNQEGPAFDYSRVAERLRGGFGWMVDNPGFYKTMDALRAKDPRLAGLDFLEWVSRQMKTEGVASPGREGLFMYRIKSPDIQGRYLATLSAGAEDPAVAAQLEYRRNLARAYGYPVDGQEPDTEEPAQYLTEFLNSASTSIQSIMRGFGFGQQSA